MELNIIFVVFIIISATEVDNSAAHEYSKPNLVCSKNEINGQSCPGVDPPSPDFEKPNSQTDFVIYVAGEKFYVSKTILALVSPNFQRALNSNEFKQSSMELDNSNIEDVREFLRCIYPNFLSPVTIQNAEKILPLVHYFEVSHLKKKCEQVLIEHVEYNKDKGDRLLELLDLSVKYELDNLSEKCMKELSIINPYEIMSASQRRTITDSTKAKLFEMAYISRMQTMESAENMINMLVEGFDHIKFDKYVGKFVNIRVIDINDFPVTKIVNICDSLPVNITVFVREQGILFSYKTLNIVITKSRETGGYMKAKVILDDSLSKHHVTYVKDFNKEVEIVSSLNEVFQSNVYTPLYTFLYLYNGSKTLMSEGK